MNAKDFENFEAVRYWMDSLSGRSDTTKRKYLEHLSHFCVWLQKTPDELIKEREEDLKSSDKKIRHKAELDVKRFMDHLRSEEKAPDTIRLHIVAIKSFYQHHFLRLEFLPREGPGRKGAPRRRVTKDEILKILNVCDVRDRALIFFLKDSGLSVSDVTKLTYGDIKEDFEAGREFINIGNSGIKRRKTGIPINTFIGPEAVDALRVYLDQRRRGTTYPRGEGYPPEKITDETPLFRSLEKRKGVSHSKVKPFVPVSITIRVLKLAKRAGVKNFSAHRIRKYFQTMLENGGVPANWVQIMMSHKLPGQEGYYSMPSTEQLREAYTSAYPHLIVLTSQINHVHQKIDQRQVDFFMTNLRMLQMMGIITDEQLKEAAEKLTKMVFATHWDPAKEPTPAIYLLQAALKRILEES